MVYQTQETQAQEVISRLKTAGVDSVCLWMHTSQLQAENKNPNKMNMIAHLLKPLGQMGGCRLFFLHGGDILIIGGADIQQKSEPFLDRVYRVLSHDTFIQSVGMDFYTIYPILMHADLLITALKSAKNNRPHRDMTLLWHTLTPKLETIMPQDVMTKDVILNLTPTSRQTVARLCVPDMEKLSGLLHMPTYLLSGQMRSACVQMIWHKNSDLSQYYNAHPLPAFIYFNMTDVLSDSFELFMKSRHQKTIVCLSAEEILTNEHSFDTLKKLHTLRVPWALHFTHGETVALIDFSKVKPEYVCVPFFEDLSDHIPMGLDKKRIIITRLKSDTHLLDLLRNGFSFFCGPIVDLLLGASCQQKCPYGDTCLPDLCQRIWTGKVSASQCVFPDFREKFILSEQEEL